MPVFEDWLKDPLSIINNIFVSDPINFETKLHDYFETKLSSEKNYYSIPCLNEVCIHELTPNCLVRYRCMVQDAFDPVYYYAINQIKYKSTNELQYANFKYREILDSDDYEICDNTELSSDPKFSFLKNEHQNLQQRMSLYCVPIPGESEWVKNVYRSQSSHTSASSSFTGSSSNTQYRPSKRTIELTNEKTEQITADTEDLKLDHNENGEQGQKKIKTGETDSVSVNPTNDITLSFPLSTNETGLPCLVKIYEDFDSYRINDMVEFIGILSQDPSLAYMHDEHSDSVYMSATNQQMTNKNADDVSSMDIDQSALKSLENNNKKQILSAFPPSLVPRLNSIKSYRLIHNNPLLNRFSAKIKEPTEEKLKDETDEQTEYWKIQMRMFLTDIMTNEEKKEQSNKICPLPINDLALFENSRTHLLNIRQELISCFQEILLGDVLAAEYLLMHLLSSVFTRRDVTVLGKFSLNITNVPQAFTNNAENKNFTSCFFKAIKQFISMGHLYHLKVDSLNNSNFIPVKDYAKDKLLSGMLQLPEHFELVIDETGLSSGELKQKGLMNVGSIKDIIQWQRLSYDFSYHQQEFFTNMRILVLSNTKSILPFDCQIKLKTNEGNLDSLENYEKFILNLIENNNLLDYFRRYLCVLAKQEYKISDSIQKVIEEDIVHLRQNFSNTTNNGNNSNGEKKVLGIEDIHLLLIVARLQCLSYGRSDLNIFEWNKAKNLEFERLNTRI